MSEINEHTAGLIKALARGGNVDAISFADRLDACETEEHRGVVVEEYRDMLSEHEARIKEAQQMTEQENEEV